MLVANIRKKLSRSKELVLSVGHSSGSGMMEPIQGKEEVCESRGPGESERLTWTGEQTYMGGRRPSTLLGLLNLSTRMTA